MNKVINMYFAPFKTCNLRCQYCYVPKMYKGEKKVGHEQIINSLQKLISKIESENYQIGSFCLHGSEPALMKPETLATVSRLVKAHWKSQDCTHKSIAIQSNGTLFTKKYLENLKSLISNPEDIKLGFSIDPPVELHNKFRDNSFELVEKNFNNAIKTGFKVSTLSVVTNETLDYLEEFKNWMGKNLERQQKSGNPYKVKIKLASFPQPFKIENSLKLADFLIENGWEKLIQILNPGYCLHAGNECEWYEFDIEGNCYSCNKNYYPEGIFADWHQETIAQIISKRKSIFSDVPTNSDCGRCEYEMICNSGCPTDRIKDGKQAGKAHECDLIQAILKNKEDRGINFIDFYNQG